jgi:hypothetical protein
MARAHERARATPGQALHETSASGQALTARGQRGRVQAPQALQGDGDAEGTRLAD